VITNETSTIETKFTENKEEKSDVNFGNPEASHAKLEEKKNKTFFPPTPIKYRTEQNATTIETTAIAAVQVKAHSKDIESKVENSLKGTGYTDINYGNPEAYHAKLEVK
jgi:hypothetical protein